MVELEAQEYKMKGKLELDCLNEVNNEDIILNESIGVK